MRAPKKVRGLALWALGGLLASALWCEAGWAYTVSSDFADPCHEQLVIEGYLNSAVDFDLQGVPLPTSEVWRKLSESVLSGIDLEIPLNDTQRLIIVSLMAGIRSPDTAGRGLLDLDTLRQLHASPDGQYIHALRAVEDDGAEGDLKAIEGIRQEILASYEQVLDYIALPSQAQLIEVDFYLDFYGPVPLEVWAPAFYLGRLLHTLQDSFSHTLRSDDLRRVRHVFNYVDAIGSDHDEEQDGLAHSDSMDSCVGETAPLYNAAREATLDVFIGLSSPDLIEDPGGPIVGVLDKWLTHESGCSYANAYCGSKWVAIARLEPTGPYLETLLGCTVTSDEGGGPPWLPALAVTVAAALRARRRR